MSHRLHPLERANIYDGIADNTYIGDRIFVFIQFAFLAVLPLGIVLASEYLSEAQRRLGTNVVGFSINWLLIFGLAVLWFHIWFGARWAFVVYAVVIGYLTVQSMIDKGPTPWFALASLTYVVLRVTHSVGPKLEGSSE